MKNLLILFLIILISCQKKEPPRQVLTKEQFSALLVDIYLAEARVQSLPMNHDSLIKFYLPHEQKVLTTRGVSDSVLKNTYTYYYAHPKEFEEVYDRVIDTLTLREQKYFQLNKGGSAKPAKQPK
ncbi:MAG: hypothetical protein OJF59_003072 [Cytophagales bacterium]|jgi:hypothetical protein|nr:DUF4296 domain-containing protein [Bacteroidota bacterium]MBS1981297.1 DUF4296 domain-containing protein [Bacteroidota bacterium]WHZ09316.1 MAG: hypothetical protein OJF59_003072 [Cytophagales bacterium]